MSSEIIAFMLGVSLVMGFCGLLGFLWGLRNNQFDDENKMLEGVLFDSPEELNRAANSEMKRDFLSELNQQNQTKGEQMSKVYDVAIVGAGPAGIGAAVESAILGLDVALFEKTDAHNGMIRNFYKDGKRVDREYKGQVVELNGNIDFEDGNKESFLEFCDGVLSKNNVSVQGKVEVEKISKDGDIFVLHTSQGEIKAKFAVIAIGKMGQPNKPSYTIPGAIKRQVQFNANGIDKSEKLLVVGGGNSAVEYANALCNDNDTTLNYRRTEFARINDTNATELKANFDSGALKSILGVDIEGLEDADGKVKVNFANGDSQTFDRVIYAIGGAAPIDFLQKCGIELNENAPVVKDNETSIKGLFIAGDIAQKSGGCIAAGFKHGFEIAQAIKNRI